MRQIMIISLLFNLILGFAIWGQTDAITTLEVSNKTLANNIKVINLRQINENRIAREILERARVSEAWAKYLAPMYIRAAKANSTPGNKVDPLVLVRMGDAESNYKQYAVSPKGAQGIQQIMWKYWKGKEVTYIKTSKDLFDPEKNIHYSAYILAHYQKVCGGVRGGVTCYNGGKRALKYPKIETINYVAKVLKGYNENSMTLTI